LLTLSILVVRCLCRSQSFPHLLRRLSFSVACQVYAVRTVMASPLMSNACNTSTKVHVAIHSCHFFRNVNYHSTIPTHVDSDSQSNTQSVSMWNHSQEMIQHPSFPLPHLMDTSPLSSVNGNRRWNAILANADMRQTHCNLTDPPRSGEGMRNAVGGRTHSTLKCLNIFYMFHRMRPVAAMCSRRQGQGTGHRRSPSSRRGWRLHRDMS
jgi:hypothetical protein